MDVETARETIAAEAPRRLRLDELLRELGALRHDGAFTVAALVDDLGLAHTARS